MPDNEQEEETCVTGFVKFSLCFFSFLLLLMGPLLIGLGIWSYPRDNKWSYIEKNTFYHQQTEDVYDFTFAVSIVVIIAGILLFLVAFMGCLGALRENICLLKTFAATIAILFVLEVVGVILAFVFSSEIKHIVAKLIKPKYLVLYREDIDYQNVVDMLQETFGCCGVDGYRDWSLNEYFNCTERNPTNEKCGVPFSCCREPRYPITGMLNYTCGFNAQKLQILTAQKVIYTTGCFQTIVKFAESDMYIVRGVILGIAVAQLIAIFLAIVMISQIRLLVNQATDNQATSLPTGRQPTRRHTTTSQVTRFDQPGDNKY